MCMYVWHMGVCLSVCTNWENMLSLTTDRTWGHGAAAASSLSSCHIQILHNSPLSFAFQKVSKAFPGFLPFGNLCMTNSNSALQLTLTSLGFHTRTLGVTLSWDSPRMSLDRVSPTSEGDLPVSP